MKIRTCCLMVLLLSGLAMAQTDMDIDALIVQGKAHITEAVNTWNLQKMMGARAYFERLMNDDTYPWLIQYYIAFVDLQIVYFHLGSNNPDEAKKFIDDGIDALEKAVALKDDFAEAYALMASMLGQQIGLNPMLGMTLGMKSGTMMGKAFSLAPENPRISLIAGQSAYFTPKMFGGGKEKAKEHLEKSIQLFQTFQPEKPIFPTWGHENAHAFLGLVHMDMEAYDTAKLNFEKALEINPDYGWVKYELMKQLEEKMGKEGNR